MELPILIPATQELRRSDGDVTAVQSPPILMSGTDRKFYYRCKRMLDVMFAAVLLIALLPLLLTIAILIKLNSSGPVIYRHTRIGSRRRSGRGVGVWELCTFASYKFRSMFVDADQSIHRQYIEQFCNGNSAEASNGAFKLKNDPRVTPVGRLLRRTSLDELPQLVNVLRGEMSLVGPRPVPAYEVAHYEKAHYERFAAPPGLTGLWQVRGRGRVPFQEMMRMDIEYARTSNVWLDLKILLLTIPAVVTGRGAE